MLFLYRKILEEKYDLKKKNSLKSQTSQDTKTFSVRGRNIDDFRVPQKNYMQMQHKKPGWFGLLKFKFHELRKEEISPSLLVKLSSDTWAIFITDYDHFNKAISMINNNLYLENVVFTSEPDNR